MTDVANRLARKFSRSLSDHAGPGLPNPFEEAFVWHLAWKKGLADAYMVAGYLGSGDVAKKAATLLGKPDVAARSLVVAKAMGETLCEFSSTFQYWNVQPPVQVQYPGFECDGAAASCSVVDSPPGQPRLPSRNNNMNPILGQNLVVN